MCIGLAVKLKYFYSPESVNLPLNVFNILKLFFFFFIRVLHRNCAGVSFGGGFTDLCVKDHEQDDKNPETSLQKTEACTRSKATHLQLLR